MPATAPPGSAQKVAELLLAAPDPMYAIAHFVAESEHRIDALGHKVTAAMQTVATLRHRVDQAGVA